MRQAAGLGAAALVTATLSVIASPAGAESQTFFNTSAITFSGDSSSGGSQYPSTIDVSGLEGPITDVDLHINGITMDNLAQLQLLLVSPSGEAEAAKVYACYDDQVANLQLSFDQQAATALPHDGCADGTYRPTSTCGAGCPIFAEFPGAYSLNFNNFNGENANGTWRLYAYRSCSSCLAGDKIAAGWSISIDTGPVDVDLPTGSATFGAASPYPATQTVPFGTDVGLITDLNVRLEGIWHSHPDDLEIMLEKAGGPKVMLMSDACGSFDATAYMWVWDDEAAALMPDDGTTNVCATTSQRPTDHNPGDSLPAPAPAAPYGTSLSAFDLVDPRGEWRMWIADDAAGDEGFTTHRFQLEYTVRPRAATSFLAGGMQVGEGETVPVTVIRAGVNAYATGTVTVTSTPGTATADDFTAVSETLSFAPGETQKTLQMTVADDGTLEQDEYFTLALSSATGDARISSPGGATVVVPANDGAKPDTLAPDTTITKAPKATTRKSRARLTFKADDPDARFLCRVDKAKWKACSSPLSLKNLKPGKHKVKVRAVDPAGNRESKAAVARWRVLR